MVLSAIAPTSKSAPLYIRQQKRKKLTEKGEKNDRNYNDFYDVGSRICNPCPNRRLSVQAEMEGTP